MAKRYSAADVEGLVGGAEVQVVRELLADPSQLGLSVDAQLALPVARPEVADLQKLAQSLLGKVAYGAGAIAILGTAACPWKDAAPLLEGARKAAGVPFLYGVVCDPPPLTPAALLSERFYTHDADTSIVVCVAGRVTVTLVPSGFGSGSGARPIAIQLKPNEAVLSKGRTSRTYRLHLTQDKEGSRAVLFPSSRK